MKLTNNEMTKLAKRVLSQASVGDLRVRIDARREGNTRFAVGAPTTGGDVERLEVSVTASLGAKSATATGNAVDDASLLSLVSRAEAMAALAPENPEHMPPLGKTKLERVRAFDSATARLTAEQRAAAVKSAIDAAKGAGVDAAGFLQHQARVQVVADRSGLLAAHDRTSVSMTTTCRTAKGGSARRGFTSHSVAGLDAGALASDAAAWARRSSSPQTLQPGKYTLVMAPEAVADLLGFFVDALSSRAASEGRSVFSKPGGGTTVGEAMFASALSVWSDPADPKHPASPMTAQGEPQVRTEWVKGGRLLALTADRYWADRTGVVARPRPSSIHMSTGGTGDAVSLISGVDRGVFVSRLWYNRMLSRRTLTVTGLTRDGTYLIEKGKLGAAVNNFRYNDSPLTMLTRLLAAGAPVRTGADRVTVVPPVVVEGFNFESICDAI